MLNARGINQWFLEKQLMRWCCTCGDGKSWMNIWENRKTSARLGEHMSVATSFWRFGSLEVGGLRNLDSWLEDCGSGRNVGRWRRTLTTWVWNWWGCLSQKQDRIAICMIADQRLTDFRSNVEEMFDNAEFTLPKPTKRLGLIICDSFVFEMLAITFDALGANYERRRSFQQK